VSKQNLIILLSDDIRPGLILGSIFAGWGRAVGRDHRLWQHSDAEPGAGQFFRDGRLVRWTMTVSWGSYTAVAAILVIGASSALPFPMRWNSC